MATTVVTFGRMPGIKWGTDMPMLHGGTFVSETITPTASNQQTTQVAAGTEGSEMISVARVATDTSVYVAFGTSPNALTSTAARAMVPAGSVDYFAVQPGWKAAVVNAP